jgi:two-component system, OmpR family, response regulator VicR
MQQQTKKTVVYIEDDPEMIDLVTLIVSRRGYQVLGAHGGREGLDIVQNNLPDLILLDLMMPDLDGWDVYHQLKAQELTQHIPVIIITAKSQEIDRVLCLHIAKVDDYISKPFRPAELLESMDKVLAQSQVSKSN